MISGGVGGGGMISISVLRVARGSTSSVPKRLVRFPAFRGDFVSAF